MDKILSEILPDKPTLTRKELAECLSTTPGRLAKKAVEKKGPPFIKDDGRVLYPRAAVIEWMKANTHGGKLSPVT